MHSDKLALLQLVNLTKTGMLSWGLVEDGQA